MKNFDIWNEKKKVINEKPIVIGVNEREIWWMTLGLNVGIETNGKHDEFKRPALVIKRFNKDMVWILPMTSKNKSPIFYEKFIVDGVSYFAAITQIKTVSTKRFLRKINTIKGIDFNRVLKKVINFFPTINEDPR